MGNFNPREHLINIKNRQGAAEYLPVAWRLVWFREQCPNGTIDTEEVIVDIDREVTAEKSVWNAEKRRSEMVQVTARGYARYKAIVTDGTGGRATGHGSETAIDFPDYIEKAETKAIGRALAALGYGTQFAPDLDEAHRIVDSPVPPPASASGNENTSTSNVPAAAAPESEAVATEEQQNSIRKLCERMGKKAPENVTTLSYLAARKVIRDLTTEYRELKQNRAS